MVEIETIEHQKVSASSNSNCWKPLMGEDLVMKVLKSERPRNGKDPAPVQLNDAVMIDFVARIANDRSCTDGPILQEVKDWFIVVGQGDVLPALELAIRFMDSGSTACIWSHSKYSFSSGTRIFANTKLKPNTNIMFEVMVSQKILDTSRLNPYFTIMKAVSRKAIANDVYQNEWCPPPKSDAEPNCDAAMSRAVRLYKKAAQEMETLLGGTYFKQVEENHPQRLQATQILLDSLNNIVAVYLRQKQYHEAKNSAIEVLKLDPKNTKALLRVAKASLLDPASTMEEVQAALRAADSEITYKHPQEEKELKRIKAHYKKRWHEYKNKTKEMFSNKLNVKGSAHTEDTGNPSISDGISDRRLKSIAISTDTENIRLEDTHERKSTTTLARCCQVVFFFVSVFLAYRFLNDRSLTIKEKSPGTESTEDVGLSGSVSEIGLEL